MIRPDSILVTNPDFVLSPHGQAILADASVPQRRTEGPQSVPLSWLTEQFTACGVTISMTQKQRLSRNDHRPGPRQAMVAREENGQLLSYPKLHARGGWVQVNNARKAMQVLGLL